MQVLRRRSPTASRNGFSLILPQSSLGIAPAGAGCRVGMSSDIMPSSPPSRCSSGVEQLIRNEQVVGSNPTSGSLWNSKSWVDFVDGHFSGSVAAKSLISGLKGFRASPLFGSSMAGCLPYNAREAGWCWWKSGSGHPQAMRKNFALSEISSCWGRLLLI